MTVPVTTSELRAIVARVNDEIDAIEARHAQELAALAEDFKRRHPRLDAVQHIPPNTTIQLQVDGKVLAESVLPAERIRPEARPFTPPPAPESDEDLRGLALWWSYRRDIFGAAWAPLLILALAALLVALGEAWS